MGKTNYQTANQRLVLICIFPEPHDYMAVKIGFSEKQYGLFIVFIIYTFQTGRSIWKYFIYKFQYVYSLKSSTEYQAEMSSMIFHI